MNKTLLQVPINNIKPDKNQPRQRFRQADLQEMAENIQFQGIINPIEIDQNYTIVTGERRWKAAKLAGLKEMPCILNDIHGKERFLRQVSENVHHNTMAPLDIAKAYRKLITLYKVCQVGPGHSLDKGITWLHEQTGKSRKQIGEMLSILEESDDFQKAVEKEEIYYTLIRPLKRVPKQHKKKLEKKILSKDIKQREIAERIVISIKTHPDKAEEILKKSYKGLTVREAETYLDKIAPDGLSDKHLKAELSEGMEINEAITTLLRKLNDRPLDQISKTNFNLVMMGLMQLRKKIKDYVQGCEISNT